jgi:hypothetical protein
VRRKPESKPHYNHVSKVYTPNFSLKIAATLAGLAADELCYVSLSDPDCATVWRKAVFISHYVTTLRHEHADNLSATILPKHKKREQRRRRRRRRKLRNERTEKRK